MIYYCYAQCKKMKNGSLVKVYSLVDREQFIYLDLSETELDTLLSKRSLDYSSVDMCNMKNFDSNNEYLDNLKFRENIFNELKNLLINFFVGNYVKFARENRITNLDYCSIQYGMLLNKGYFYVRMPIYVGRLRKSTPVVYAIFGYNIYTQGYDGCIELSSWDDIKNDPSKAYFEENSECVKYYGTREVKDLNVVRERILKHLSTADLQVLMNPDKSWQTFKYLKK